jgi:phosphoglycolate phosphatase-like HAD superfamily hydrolase
MGVVGYPLAAAFERLFADLAPDARACVLARCVEEEERALARGAARLFPGALEELSSLRAQGLRLGIASTCGARYLDLDTVLGRTGLGDCIDEARCLDSPGVATKADMVADLLATFGTRSAVMVGDRVTDRDAAWENGLPHVHLAHGFAAPGEDVRAEAVLASLAALERRLADRAAWIGGILDRLDLARARVLGVTGPPRSGKTLFARDAARMLAARGREVRVVAADGLPRGALERELRGGGDGLVLLEGRTLEAAPPDGPLLRLVVSAATLARRGSARGEEPPARAAALEVEADNPLGPARG